MDASRNPDIQRLLASLRNSNSGSATYSNSTVQNHSNQQVARTEQPQTTNSSNFVLPGLGLLPEVHSIKQNVQAVRQDLTPLSRSITKSDDDVRERPTTPAPPDASSITTWPAALKYITKHVATNEKIANKIKHLISEQHKHENQWWTAREAIIARQSGRSTNQQKAADLLRSLGGITKPIAASDPKADQAELEAFDRKVYKGLTDMAQDFDRQLRIMGIPFYAIKHDLVILENGKEKDGVQKGRIDKGELRELQKRTIQTLEDLFGDD